MSNLINTNKNGDTVFVGKNLERSTPINESEISLSFPPNPPTQRYDVSNAEQTLRNLSSQHNLQGQPQNQSPLPPVNPQKNDLQPVPQNESNVVPEFQFCYRFNKNYTRG